MSARKSVNIIYDGECAFCRRVLEAVEKLDARGALRFYDAHDAGIFARFPQLLGKDVREAMYAVVEGAEPSRGFYAFRRMLRSSPSLWPLLVLFYFPGATILGPRIYSWVARNRYRFGCRSDFCALPTELKTRRP